MSVVSIPHRVVEVRRSGAIGGAPRLLAVLALVALFAVACGDDGDEAADTGEAVTGTTEAATGTTEAPTGTTEATTGTTEAATEREGGNGAAAEAVTIDIVSVSQGFEPSTATVAVGTEVTWVNADSIAHTTTAEDGTWDSGTLEPGAEFSFTPDEAGTYPYICSIHPSMQAELVVE